MINKSVWPFFVALPDRLTTNQSQNQCRVTCTQHTPNEMSFQFNGKFNGLCKPFLCQNYHIFWPFLFVAPSYVQLLPCLNTYFWTNWTFRKIAAVFLHIVLFENNLQHPNTQRWALPLQYKVWCFETKLSPCVEVMTILIVAGSQFEETELPRYLKSKRNLGQMF